MHYESNQNKLTVIGYFLLVTGFFTANAFSQIVVTNTDDSGDGSIRWAIEKVNSTSESDIITFNIPGEGPHMIQPESQFPDIIHPLDIDGSSQPGYTSGSPQVVLDGIIGGDISGLIFDGIGSSESTVQGMSLINFEKDTILLQNGTSSNTITSNFIGLDPAGTVKGKEYGINVFNSFESQIGGILTEDRNIIRK